MIRQAPNVQDVTPYSHVLPRITAAALAGCTMLFSMGSAMRMASRPYMAVAAN